MSFYQIIELFKKLFWNIDAIQVSDIGTTTTTSITTTVKSVNTLSHIDIYDLSVSVDDTLQIK